MLGLMVLGLVWLVVYYLWGANIPFIAVAGQLELRDRVRADDLRPADDHAVALTVADRHGGTVTRRTVRRHLPDASPTSNNTL